MFRLSTGHEDGFVTPFLSLPDVSLKRCRNYNITGCARYPINALHAHDTESSRSFFFQLHVTNAAGHVTSVNTSSVRLPARFPPSHAVVMDVVKKAVSFKTTARASAESWTEAPADSTTAQNLPTSASSAHETTRAGSAQFSQDVDAILERNEVCVMWSGFYHAEEVKIEIGMGTKPGQDDIISFYAVENHSPVCLNLTSAAVYTKLFSVVRATNSGGMSLFSSDGFVMIPEGDVMKNMKVFSGKACTAADVLGSQSINQTLTELVLSSLFDVTVHTGDTLFVQFSPFISNVTFANAVLLQTTLTGYQIVVTSPTVKAQLPSSASRNTSVHIISCLKDSILLRASPQNHVMVTWEALGQWTRHVKSLKVEVVDNTCLTMLPKKEKYRQHRCLLISKNLNKAERGLRVDARDLIHGHTYYATLSPSFDDEHFFHVSSQYFTYDTTQRSLIFQRAAITSRASQELEIDVKVLVQPSVSAVIASGQGPCLLKWAVARDKFGSTLLADWAIADSTSCSELEVKCRW